MALAKLAPSPESLTPLHAELFLACGAPVCLTHSGQTERPVLTPLLRVGQLAPCTPVFMRFGCLTCICWRQLHALLEGALPRL